MFSNVSITLTTPRLLILQIDQYHYSAIGFTTHNLPKPGALSPVLCWFGKIRSFFFVIYIYLVISLFLKLRSV